MSLCPYNPPPRARRRWRSPRIPATPNNVHLRLHGDRRRLEVRAQLGLPALGRRPARGDSSGGELGAWTPQTFRSSDYYDVCKVAAHGRRTARTARATRRTARWSTCSTRRQIIWPNAIENPWSASNPDSLWMMAQEYFISTGARSRRQRAQGIRAAADALPGAVARPASATTSRSSIGSSTTTSRTGAGRARSPTRPASRSSRRPTARTTSTPRATSRCPGTAARARRRSARRCPECCGAGPTPGLDRGVRRPGDGGLQDGGVAVAGRARSGRATCRHDDQSILPEVPVRAGGRRRCAPTAPAGPARRRRCPAGRAIRSGRARPSRCAIYGGAPRETVGALLGDGAGRPGARDAARARGERRLRRPGPHLRAPRLLVHAARATSPATSSCTRSTRAPPTGRPAPPTLIRNGIVHVPRCAHSEHVAGAALV